MARQENLYCEGMRANSKEYLEGWDRIFGKKKKKKETDKKEEPELLIKVNEGA